MRTRLTRAAARIEPRTNGTHRTSCSTAHGTEVPSQRTTQAGLVMPNKLWNFAIWFHKMSFLSQKAVSISESGLYFEILVAAVCHHKPSASS